MATVHLGRTRRPSAGTPGPAPSNLSWAPQLLAALIFRKSSAPNRILNEPKED